MMDTAPDTILSWPQVEARVGIHRTTAYRATLRNEFPAPVRITRNRVGWRESELNAWLSQRKSAVA